MFNTFIQFILSAALSVGLAAGISPDVRDRLDHFLNKAEAVTSQVADLATQTANDLVEKVSGGTTIGASADAGTSISDEDLSSQDTDMDTSIEDGSEEQGQADINVSTEAKVQTSDSIQSLVKNETSLDVLVTGSVAGK